jgi:hypothetical protein
MFCVARTAWAISGPQRRRRLLSLVEIANEREIASIADSSDGYSA